ncbi:MAG: hypothetical protein ACRD10_03845 [Terriglobia bacterium]
MASPTTVYITPKQRKELFGRARRHGTSFSEELRSAVDFYLGLPAEADPKALAELAREANHSLDRSLARLDDTLAFLAERRNGKP